MQNDSTSASAQPGSLHLACSAPVMVCGDGHVCGPGHYAYARVRGTKKCPHRIRYLKQFVGWTWKSCGRVMKAQTAICSPHRDSRCGVCYWALYDGDWCQNPKCVMCGKSVNENRIYLTNREAHILIEANAGTERRLPPPKTPESNQNANGGIRLLQ
jgi:hypothetical protein